MFFCPDQDGTIVTGGKRTLIIKPSPIRQVSDREVRFDVSLNEVEVEGKGGGWLSRRRKRRNSKDSKEDFSDADPLVEVTFKELLKLNLPDWYLVVSGVLASAILGALFPVMSILFSGILEVIIFIRDNDG